MEKEIRRQMIFGTVLAIVIFIGILAIINGLDLAVTFLTTSKSAPVEPDITVSSPIHNQVSFEKIAPEFHLPDREFTLYFPGVVQSPTTYTKIQLQNNTGEIITDAETTIMGSRGDWRRYRPFTIEDYPYRLETKNLANLPPDMNPGLLIITSNSPVAGIATLINASGFENNPTTPYLDLARDLFFRFDRNRDGTTAQNSLIISNLNPRIAEIQLSFSGQSPDITNVTLGPLELKPWETKIFNLRQLIQNQANYSDFSGLLVSGTAPNFIAVIADVDESLQTWKNLAVGEVR